jgi:hypothetical protein
MVWGVGTGRCGTQSLVQEREGMHLPVADDNILRALALAWAQGSTTEADERVLRLSIDSWRQTEYPILVDWYFSYIMDLIEEEDPDAGFVFVYRDPVKCCASMFRDSWWVKRDVRCLDSGVTHPKLSENVLSVVNRYIITNDLIARHLGNSSNNYEVLRTEDLKVHIHKGFSGRVVQWNDNTKEIIRDLCEPTIKRIQTL